VQLRRCCFAVFAGVLLVDAGVLSAQERAYEELQTFSAVLNHVRLNYVDSVTYRPLVRAAIAGVLHSLDPHSAFVAVPEREIEERIARGELLLPGISLESVGERITVLSVGPDSPAARAGLLPGDRIVEVRDTPVVGLSADEVQLHLAAPKGKSIGLKVERGLLLEPASFKTTIRSAEYQWPVVLNVHMLDRRTGYVRLSQFGEKARQQVHDATKSLLKSGADRIVLDLRGNPGGLVAQAVDLASEFLPAKTLVFRTRGRKIDANQDYVTQSKGEFVQVPLVLLVDHGSASASEALAGALQDHDRAVIVGRRTFGKALVQATLPLPSGDIVRLTIARVLTPSGRFIQRNYTGLGASQYWALAGTAGSGGDTVKIFYTEHKREVKGGGGIAPDVAVEAFSALPVWVSAARDSAWDTVIADSVAATLAPDSAARSRWLANPAAWLPLVAQLQARARRLGIAAELSPEAAREVARLMAARAAHVRWNAETGWDLLGRNDPDIQAALGAFSLLHSSQ
jgi:carboxyl-terminal processing protease